MLGDVQPGKHQLAVESNMFRSIACAHAAPDSDFLVIRAASGALTVREVTGFVTVGQQEPLRRIPVPQSKECRSVMQGPQKQVWQHQLAQSIGFSMCRL